jgi:regulator of protease activity HflC (stomatin/prohibitin superfamily)
MSEFLRAILDFIKELWPVAVVDAWEQGVLFRMGTCKGARAAGWYFVWPYADKLLTVSMLPAPIFTGRQDVTAGDGTVVSFVASAIVQVTDAERVLVGVDDYQESAREILSSVLADKIASVDAERLKPDGRGRLLSSLTRWADDELSPFGMTVSKVRFATFVSSARTYRIMQDQSSGMGGW